MARRTKGSAFSSWPTARAQMANGTGGNQQGAEDLQTAVDRWPTPTAKSEAQTAQNPTPGQTGGTTLAGAAEQLWQTPVSDDQVAREKGKFNSRGEPKLSGQAQMWTTPQAHDVTMRGSGQVPTNKAGNACLARDATNWPTPASRDHKGENSTAHLENGTGRMHLDQLPNFVAHSFSHPARATWPHGQTSSRCRQASRQIFRSAMLNVPATTLRRWLKAGTWRKRRLNPLFVEWLMGWPPGHALCDCSETEWSHYKQHMRGALLALPTAYGPWIWEPPTITEQPTQGSLFDAL